VRLGSSKEEKALRIELTKVAEGGGGRIGNVARGGGGLVTDVDERLRGEKGGSRELLA
jgi:hypothetical protein